MKTIMALLIAALVASANTAHAQGLVYGPMVGYGGGEAAGTPAGAAMHGAADMVRAQGVYNDMTASGMVKVEQARQKYIANQRQWTDLYMMRQRVVDGQHEQARQEARARNERYRDEQIFHVPLPARLTSRELNPSTGRVEWPQALKRDSFALERRGIEELLASRTDPDGVSERSELLADRIGLMREDLRGHIRQLMTPEYMEARKFLDRLSLEARYPVADPAYAGIAGTQADDLSTSQEVAGQ